MKYAHKPVPVQYESENTQILLTFTIYKGFPVWIIKWALFQCIVYYDYYSMISSAVSVLTAVSNKSEHDRGLDYRCDLTMMSS